MTTRPDRNQIKTDRSQEPDTPRKLFRLISCILILLAGLVTAFWLVKTKPKVNRKPPVTIAPLVETLVLEPTTYQVRVPATGTIVPSRQVVIKVPVSGKIVAASPDFVEGGTLHRGDMILQIDRTDYELLVQQKQTAVSEAEYAIKLEEGRQEVARQEWQLLYGTREPTGPDSDLALRRPHLEKVRMDLEGARAELEQARLNLERTLVKSPFNALVLHRYVSQGSEVSAQEQLAELVDSDVYWARVSLPAERLRWLQIPGEEREMGSPTEIIYRDGNVRHGKIIRLLPNLSSEGRMARLLIAIPNPLAKKGSDKPPLLLGEYVRVAIGGRTLSRVYRIPRAALHNDREVWILGDDNRLAVRPVSTVWRDEETILISEGFSPGDRLIVSGLATPVEGMALRREDSGEPGAKSDQNHASSGPSDPT